MIAHISVAICMWYQSAVGAVERGLSLWLPQLQSCSKSAATSAEDSIEVCWNFSYEASVPDRKKW